MQNYGESKKISDCQRSTWREELIAEAEGILMQNKYYIYITMVDICQYTFVITHRMYNTNSDSNVNYGHWLIVMCQLISRVTDIYGGYFCIKIHYIF